MRRILVLCLLVFSGPMLATAQIAPDDSVSSAQDSPARPAVSLQGIPDSTALTADSLDAGALAPAETAMASAGFVSESSALPTVHGYGSWIWDRDSISLLPYQHAGDIFALHPFVQLADLGNFGQPHGILAASSVPQHGSVSLNGLPFDDILTGMTATAMLPSQDAATITVYPQYQSFWYGSPGDVFAADIEQKEWDAPRPITRLRHTEAANEYLFTDAMFTLNPTETSNVYVAGTRMTIGTTGSNVARFVNNLAESWNLRGRYREKLSDLFTTSISVRYNDDITYMNGGVLGFFDPTSLAYRFEEDGAGDFTASAFDPITAEAGNATMMTQRQRYTATGTFAAFWTADSSQVTHIRVEAASDVRRFRDDLSDVEGADQIIPQFNLTDHWSLLRAELDHETALPWARLQLRGHVARYAAEKGGAALDESGLETGARGRLDLLLGPVALSGFAALNYSYDQTAVSLGAGGELPLGPLALWGGLSFSPRIRSFLMTDYRPPLLVTGGDRTPDLDKVSVAEGGLRLSTLPLQLDMRGFIRREDRYLLLQTTPFQGEISGRYSLVVMEIPGGAAQTVTGASMNAQLSVWRLRFDQQLTYQRTESTHPLLDLAIAPELRYAASLYFRGNLIEGTLDLKAGGSFHYCSDYQPLTYHPEAGLFTLSAIVDDGARSYTDMQRVDVFLFATIKQRATLSVQFYNVLNTGYITTGFYPMYDRALRIGVDWIFFD